MSIRYESIENLQKMIKDNQIKPSEIVKDIYDAIEETDPTIQSFLALDKENAMKKAEELDTLQAKGEMEGKLFGIPMGIKDNIITEGLETTCASRMLEGFVPIYEATVMKKLHNENGILIGKVNLDEFAMGGSTETSYFKKTVNPFDHKAVPGGSSGGSAAAVASRACTIYIRYRHRWFYSPTCSVLWCCRIKTNIRSCVTFWFSCLCVITGSNWTDYT